MDSIEEAQAYADKNGYKLGPKAQRVIEAIKLSNGNCPCVAMNSPRCPCPAHTEDIKEKGFCKCRLFYA